jgi:homoserine kinase type II
MPPDAAAPIPWSLEAVRVFLAGYGRLPKRLHVQQLRSWWFNLVLLVDADGERLILRRYGVTPPDEVQWEIALLAHLNAHDFPTVRPLARSDGSMLGVFAAKPAMLYPYVEGHNGCDPALDRTHAMAETAALVGRLHHVTQNLTLPHPRVQSGTDSRRLLTQFLRWVQQRGIAPHEPRLAEFAGHVERVLGGFESRLAPHETALPRGNVHHDAHCANVVFHRGELVALIDFDDACPGYLLADLPVMLDGWATDRKADALIPDHVDTVIRAYHRARPLTPTERDLLPDFHLLYLLGDAAADVYERAAGGVSPEQAIAEWSGYRRYLRYASDPAWHAPLLQALAAI